MSQQCPILYAYYNDNQNGLSFMKSTLQMVIPTPVSVYRFRLLQNWPVDELNICFLNVKFILLRPNLYMYVVVDSMFFTDAVYFAHCYAT